jgi:hypothetical protein
MTIFRDFDISAVETNGHLLTIVCYWKSDKTSERTKTFDMRSIDEVEMIFHKDGADYDAIHFKNCCFHGVKASTIYSIIYSYKLDSVN